MNDKWLAHAIMYFRRGMTSSGAYAFESWRTDPNRKETAAMPLMEAAIQRGDFLYVAHLLETAL